MYVVIRRYTVAGSSDELMRRIKEEFVPIVTALPGFEAYHLVDCGGLEALSIGYWKSKADATRSTEQARGWVSRSALGLVPFPPEKLAGHVVLDISGGDVSSLRK